MNSDKRIIVEFLIYILAILVIILVVGGFIFLNKSKEIDNDISLNINGIDENDENNGNNIDDNNENNFSDNTQKNDYSTNDINEINNIDNNLSNENIVSENNKETSNKNIIPTIEWMSTTDSKEGLGNDIITKIKVDENNNLYAIGYTDDDFGVRKAGEFKNLGFDDYFVVKYLPNGNGEFIINPINGVQNDYVNDICVNDDDLYIIGDTTSELYFRINENDGPIEYDYRSFDNYGRSDFFAAKYEDDTPLITFFSDGDNTKNDYGKFIHVDKYDNVFLLGETETKIDFRNNVKFRNIGDNDIFLIKFDKYSKTEFAINPLIGYQFEESHLVDFEVVGNYIYVLGYGDVEYNMKSGILNNNVKTFITKISMDGNIKWTKLFPGNDENIPTKIIVNNNEEIYISMNFEKEIYIDSKKIENNGDVDFLVTKLNKNGDSEWFIHPSLSPANDYIVDFDIDYDNNLIYLTGNTEGYIEFDFDILLHSGREDFFIAQYDLDGKFNWARSSIGKTGRLEDKPLKILVHNDGAYLSMNSKSDIDFGNNVELINQGDYDFFIVKYSKNALPLFVLTTQESKEYLDEDEDRAYYINKQIDVEFSGEKEDILTDMIIKDNYLYISGITKGNLDFTNEFLVKNNGGFDFFIAKYMLND